MMTSFELFRKNTNPYVQSGINPYNTSLKNKQNNENNTLKGVLLNTHIKKQPQEENFDDFDKISQGLLIPQNPQENVSNLTPLKDDFDYKKILKPAVILTSFIVAMTAGISIVMKKYSNVLASKNDLVRPGDLARNINILEEPHFAMYRALRNPNAKNILGLLGVALMSAFTLTAKNFVDGIKEIWIKKRNCDIEHDLQQNLIQVETDVFSGKLKIVNTLLKDSSNYFKSSLKEDTKDIDFKNFLSFKGEKKEDEKDKKNNKIPYIIGGVGAFCAIGFMLFKNYQKTVKNLDTFTQKFQDSEIRAKMENALNETDKVKAIKELVDLLKVINAKEDTMREKLSSIKGIEPDEIESAIKAIKEAQIYVSAPEALGGISEKIQYYCYINEERGHLYNWILNPENKFNKYLFLCFSAISSIGYLSKTAVDAFKTTAVNRENSKSELNLRKRLVQVELNNFKTKKLSAINPLIDNFNYQKQKGASKSELKSLAENILIEIKNGPPYIYS